MALFRKLATLTFFIIFIPTVPPRFTEIPKRLIKVTANSVASVTCRAFGFPPPIIQWAKALASLPKERATVDNGTLKITSFSLEDVGTYQCKATNKLGSASLLTAFTIVYPGKTILTFE